MDLPDVQTFHQKVLHVSGPVLVAFVAQGCGWCEKFKPELAKLAQTSPIPIYTIHAQNAGPLLQQYHISGFPHVLVFKDGKVVKEHSGYTDLSSLLHLLSVLI